MPGAIRTGQVNHIPPFVGLIVSFLFDGGGKIES
jgi:hypothetical protein